MTNEKQPHFAQTLKQLREAAGLSQYALAQKAGVAKQAISRLESGTTNPAWTLIQRLSLALGVDYAAFADPAITLPEPKDTRMGRPPKGHAGEPRPHRPEGEAPPAPVAKTKGRKKDKDEG